ncbi:MAG: tetratricopeptide repeat protein [Pseudomonadota bacterium]
MKRKTALAILLIGLAGAALIGGVSHVALQGDGRSADRAIKAPSAAEARALGARWRASPTPALALDYAQSLVAAGLYDELLTEISERGLLAGDARAASVFRAEATLRQGRFEEAFAAAKAAGSGDNPYLAYARARAGYALTARAEQSADDLSRALRGPRELTADAWLFRARLALDANDFDTAKAAARRAEEAGGDPRRVEAVGIEAAIRAGDVAFAVEKLAARARRYRRSLNDDDYHLAAMLKLKTGDARSAARLFSDASLATGEKVRARLLAALAKWMSGDLAQGYSLATGVLSAAPENWMALDLALGLARDLNRNEEAAALAKRLAAQRPALAILRKMRLEESPANLDSIYAGLSIEGDDLAAGGVAAALLGGDAHLPRAVAEPGKDDLLIASLASALNKGDVRAILKAANAACDASSSPIALTLAGEAFLRARDFNRAADALERASAPASQFFTPVRLRAGLFVQRENSAAAIGLIRDFLKHNPGDVAAQLALAANEADIGAVRAAYASYAAVPPSAVFADEEAAIRFAKAAASIGPEAIRSTLEAAMDAAPSALTLGKVHAAAGDDSGAAAAFRRALIDDPVNPQSPALYLESMARQGRTDEARSFLEEILRRRPEAVAARAALES